MFNDNILEEFQPSGETVLLEITNKLQIHISKLTSQRLHLQGLIAKRDRLDYEIRCLKQRIKENRKATTWKKNSIREEAIYLLESAQPDRRTYVPNDEYNRILSIIETELAQLRSEEELLDILESLPRLGEI